MSVVNPTIDDLLSVTDENRFLLCEMAARRARDINDMMRNQHNRAEQLADIEDISAFMSDENGHAPNPLTIAFSEIQPKKDADGTNVAPGDLGFDQANLDAALGLERPACEQVEVCEECAEEAAAEDGEEAAEGENAQDDEAEATADEQ